MKRAEPVSVRATLRGLAGQLEAAGLESPAAEAERLLAHVLGVGPAELALDADRPLPAGAAPRVARLAARRAEGVPLQHLEGTVAFRDLVLRSDRRALIPRPETEQLLDLVASDARAAGATPGVRRVRRPGDPPAVERALDVGTGSGAIALSLVREGIARRAVGLDVSTEALAQAEENRALAGLTAADVELRRCDGADPFEAVRPGERFDLVVSNPPYVTTAELALLPAEIRDHEPRPALDGGADGLDLIRVIARRAADVLAAPGALYLEIGASQGEAVRALFPEAGPWREVTLHRDLAGRVRFVRARAG